MSISYLLQRSGLCLTLVRLPLRVLRRVGNQINTFWWRIHLQHLGSRTIIELGASIENPRQVVIGADCLICHGALLVSETADGSLCLEDRVQINQDVKIDHTGGVLIGKNTLISEGVTIYSHSHGTDPLSKPRGIQKTIGPSVWIGARAIIMENCLAIGKGSVVAAGSVVTKPVDPGVVAAGNPARVIRRLSDD